MTSTRFMVLWPLAAAVIAVASAMQATFAQSPPRTAAPAKGDWSLHSLDIAGGRYADLTEIMYFNAGSKMFALKADTGEQLWTTEISPSFGDKGQLSVVNRALDFAYPGRFAKDVDPVSLGCFSLTTPPTYYNGTLYIGLSHGDRS